jgi:hypothetical protein
MASHGESFADVVSVALAPNPWSEDVEPSLDRPFYDGFGGAEGDYFTVWTSSRVYFPTEYDGAESCASVARNPDGKATVHVG